MIIWCDGVRVAEEGGTEGGEEEEVHGRGRERV